MTQPYSNREIDNHFTDIKSALARIEEQTTKTNGRVSKLENWRSLLIGGWAILILFVLPILVYAYQDKLDRMERAIEQHDGLLGNIYKLDR